MAKDDVIHGIPASPGIAVGPAYIFYSEDFYVAPRRLSLDEIDDELARFARAIDEARRDLEELRRRAIEEIGEVNVGEIFSSHLQMLNDTAFFGRIPERVKHEHLNVEYILGDEIAKLRERFNQVGDEFLADRFLDIVDVCKRVQNKLSERGQRKLTNFPEPVIIVAHDLSPSETMQLERQNVAAFVTVAGGPTCHTAILAKALEIPAVVGAKAPLYRIRNGETLVVDGYRGEVTLNPDETALATAKERQAHVLEFGHELEKLRDLKAETTDGTEIALYANLDLPEEFPAVRMHGAAGIGLYRTEYIFLGRFSMPTEEEQYQAYLQVVQNFPGQRVTFRTLDVGADKVLANQYNYREINPVMGCRAIRFSLTHPDLFRTQLRAMVRAGAAGDVRILFPMVSSLEEFELARSHVREVERELTAEGMALRGPIAVGAMIEVPAAVLIGDILAKEADFLSIGTNDLIQYTLAVDRINELVAPMFKPAHPSIVRSLHHVVRAAEEAGTPLMLCGDMAGHPGFTFLLLGLGFRELSMVPAEIPEIKRIIRSVSLSDAQAVAAEALEATTATEIRRILRLRMADLLPTADFEWETWFEGD